MKITQEIAQNIRTRRKELGDISLRELARRAGMSHGYLSAIEKGGVNVKGRTLAALATALEVPMGWFEKHAPEPASEIVMTSPVADAIDAARKAAGLSIQDLADRTAGNIKWLTRVLTPGEEVRQGDVGQVLGALGVPWELSIALCQGRISQHSIAAVTEDGGLLVKDGRIFRTADGVLRAYLPAGSVYTGTHVRLPGGGQGGLIVKAAGPGVKVGEEVPEGSYHENYQLVAPGERSVPLDKQETAVLKAWNNVPPDLKAPALAILEGLAKLPKER